MTRRRTGAITVWALLLGLLIGSAARSTPPPPPPPEGNASYAAIDRLAFLAGDWEGSETDSLGSGYHAVSYRIGRFGRGADHLLIGELILYGPRKSMADVGDAVDPYVSSLSILTYDVLRGGYRLFYPGFFSDAANPARGLDELTTIVFNGPSSITWTTRIRQGSQLRTVRVDGDQWTEITGPVAGAGSGYVTHLTLHKTSRPVIWGGLAGATAPAAAK